MTTSSVGKVLKKFVMRMQNTITVSFKNYV